MERPNTSKDLQNKYAIEGNWPLLRYDDSELKIYLDLNQNRMLEQKSEPDHKIESERSLYSLD